MIYLLLLSIFVVPIASIFTKPQLDIWYSNYMALIGVGSIWLAATIWKLNKILSIFLVYLTFSYLFISFDSPRAPFCFIAAIVSILTIYQFSQTKNRKMIYAGISIMGLISIVYCIFQSFNIDPFFGHPSNSKLKFVVSFMGSRNQLGAYHLGTAFYWFPLMPLSILPIFLSKCNTALIGLLCGSIVWGMFKFGKKRTVIALLGLSLLIPIWLSHNKKSGYEIMERLNLWKLTIQQTITGKSYLLDGQIIAKCNPLFGYGLGQFFTTSYLTQTDDITYGKLHYYEHAHNDFIEGFYEFGYTGLIILSLLIFSVMRDFILSEKTNGVILTFSSLIAQSIASCGIYIFHSPISLFMFCVTLGLFYAEINQKGRM